MWISCQRVTDMGLEPHQKFFCKSNSINIAASPSQSLDTKGGVADISAVPRPKFCHHFTTNPWLTYGENFKKICKMVLELSLFYSN
jgi:hypothetical protein